MHFLGGLFLVSYGLNTSRLPGTSAPSQDIAINGSSISAGNKLQALCDLASLEQFKRLHLNKFSSTDPALSSPSPK